MNTLRLALVSDIRRRGADAVLCLVDNLSGPPLPRVNKHRSGVASGKPWHRAPR
ncbi:MAG TPA: hypothetical protein VGE36_03785 [Roseateles sp.]